MCRHQCAEVCDVGEGTLSCPDRFWSQEDDRELLSPCSYHFESTYLRGVGSVLARSNRAANYPRDGGTVSLSSFPSSLGLQKSGVSWWEREKGLLCPSFQHVPSAMGDYLPIEHCGSTSTVSLPALSCVFCDCGEAEFSSCVSCAFNSNFPCLGLASRGQLLWEFVPEKGDLSWGTWVCHEL